MIKFQKTVSKGSRFNQIYIPKTMEDLIEVGDEVEVKLVKKHVQLYYPKNLKKLSEFKQKLLKDVFSFLDKIANPAYIFVVGSFLTEKINYNDIDIVLITDKKFYNIEKLTYTKLVEKFNLKFHILFIEKKKFEYLLEVCPLTRAMFTNFVCNKLIRIPAKTFVDKKHIKFLLMMPYDLLDINLNSRTFFDNLRRLITIERFLENKSLDTITINKELEKLIKNHIYKKIKNNEEIEENTVKLLRKIIKTKLTNIEHIIKNGKK